MYLRNAIMPTFMVALLLVLIPAYALFAQTANPGTSPNSSMPDQNIGQPRNPVNPNVNPVAPNTNPVTPNVNPVSAGANPVNPNVPNNRTPANPNVTPGTTPNPVSPFGTAPGVPNTGSSMGNGVVGGAPAGTGGGINTGATPRGFDAFDDPPP